MSSTGGSGSRKATRDPTRSGTFSRIQGGKDRFQPRCGGNFVVLGEHLEGCAGVAADDDAFYIAT
ncbi:hypothetical protein, partial [Streptomyces clavuligerus]|uniref:hypothetical protein n=1 Tax=Streptomyces clavuligerus TaxID=1901 RepID=UPI001E42EDA9